MFSDVLRQAYRNPRCFTLLHCKKSRAKDGGKDLNANIVFLASVARFLLSTELGRSLFFLNAQVLLEFLIVRFG
ncbi:MAG: hypothetical protein ACXVK3_07595 [Candidatus Angelobacter sp.]